MVKIFLIKTLSILTLRALFGVELGTAQILRIPISITFVSFFCFWSHGHIASFWYSMASWYTVMCSLVSECLELRVPNILNWCSSSNLQLVTRLTKEIVETYQLCDPQFKYSADLNPKRFLTSPSTGVLNDGYDNVNSDLILTVNFVLAHLEKSKRFVNCNTFFMPITIYSSRKHQFVFIKFAFCYGADILSKMSLAKGHLDKWLNAGIQNPTVLLLWRSLKINLHTINKHWLK